MPFYDCSGCGVLVERKYVPKPPKCAKCKAEHQRRYKQRPEVKERQVEYRRRYQHKNKERINEYTRLYRHKNKERIAENKRQHWHKNKERIAERHRRYRHEIALAKAMKDIWQFQKEMEDE